MVDLEFSICRYDIKFDHMHMGKPFSQKCAQIKIFQLIVKPTDARVGETLECGGFWLLLV